MDVESLINKKKEELVEEVKQETEGLHESISNTAVDKLEKFATELKMAIDMHPIGAKDLLEVIEKEGFVYQGVVDIGEEMNRNYMAVSTFIEEWSGQIRGGGNLTGKQRVTIIIEPIGE